MSLETQYKVDGAGDGSRCVVNGTGTVLPVPFSQKTNQVGVHWLRISFPKHHLQDLEKFCRNFWGQSDADGLGLWSYDSRFRWSNGVTLNFDNDPDRSRRVHCDKITLDCPGGALDEMTACDLCLLIDFCYFYDGKCTRIDIFFDDYRRLVSPKDLHNVVERGDYSGFRGAGKRQRYESGKLIHDEVFFGSRGRFGNGKYLRFYDKFLESNGEQNSVRWEVEFTQDKADKVFRTLFKANADLDAFATLCGSLVAGCITFIHRTGEKNISRLDRYDWWQDICLILGGELSIRTERKKDSITGKMEWIKRNVSPSLSCILKLFESERHFWRWLTDILHDGENRMNNSTRQLAEHFAGSLCYEWGELQREEEKNYELSKL